MTALTTSSSSSESEPYISHHDQAELLAVKKALDSQGLGDVIYDDQTNVPTLEELLGGNGYDTTVGLVDLGGGKQSND